MKISISIPPRSGKSYIVSLFVAWWLGRLPETSVMRNTCTGRLYQKFSYDTRAIIRSEKYRAVFPGIELAPDKQNLDGWNLTQSKQVAYFGAGVGGTIIGFGATLAISDDLYKGMNDALSIAVNENIKMWKQSAHDSRKEKNCPEIYIGTRWSENDIIGEADVDEKIVIPALIDGKSFCEDVKTTEEYLKIKDEIAGFVWDAEYMQEPVDVKGRLLPLESLQFSNIASFENYDYKFAACDPADKGGDNFAALFCGVKLIENRLKIVVFDVIYSKHGVEAVSQRIIEKTMQYGCDRVQIESNGLGLAAVMLVKKELPVSSIVKAVPADDSKEVRINGAYEYIQRNFIFDQNYKNNPEYFQYITHLSGYCATENTREDNKHRTDAIDCTAQAANIVRQKFKYIV